MEREGRGEVSGMVDGVGWLGDEVRMMRLFRESLGCGYG